MVPLAPDVIYAHFHCQVGRVIYLVGTPSSPCRPVAALLGAWRWTSSARRDVAATWTQHTWSHWLHDWSTRRANPSIPDAADARANC